MLLCAKCNKKYEDGFTICAICGSELVDYQPLVDEETLRETAESLGEDAPEGYEPELAQLDEEAEPVVLITVNDHIEAGRILSILEDVHIPCFKRSDGVGNISEILTGNSFTAYDICVPSALYNQAMEAIDMAGVVSEELPAGEEWEEDAEDLSDVQDKEEQDDDTSSGNTKRTWMPLLVIGAIIVLAVLLFLLFR